MDISKVRNRVPPGISCANVNLTAVKVCMHCWFLEILRAFSLDNLVFPLKSNLKVWPYKWSILDLMWFSRLYDMTPVYAVMSPVFLCMHTVTTVTSVFKGFEYFQLLHIVTGARFNLPEKQEPSSG